MNIPAKFWNMATTSLVLLVVFLAVVSIKEIKTTAYVGTNPNMSNTINVEGSGNAVAVPDIATFTFGVTETAKTVAEAQALATTKLNSALEAVRKGGVEDKDIQTQYYSINPHYEYQNSLCTAYNCPPSKSILTGYDVSQSILVKVRKIEDAGTLFTSIGSLGVQNIGQLSFSVDEPESVQAKARAKAIANAQEKAETLAKQLGVSLVRIISFSENGNSYPRPIYGMGGADMMSTKVANVAPEVPAGEQKITSSVSITYQIK